MLDVSTIPLHMSHTAVKGQTPPHAYIQHMAGRLEFYGSVNINQVTLCLVKHYNLFMS